MHDPSADDASACLREQLDRLQERVRAMQDILEIISRSREEETPVFDAILGSASWLCDAPMAGLHIADQARTSIRLVAHRGLPEGALEASDFSLPIDSQNTTATATREGVVVHTKDLADDDLYRQGNRDRVAAVDVLGARTALTIPLLSHGVGIGCIWIFRREVRPYTEDEITLLQSFASQAVIAIENVRQFRALEERTQELNVLNAELEIRVNRQVSEIERMGRLKRFLSPAVADAVVLSGNEKLLSSHRAFIAVMFCDIRGFTAFCETAEPEETIEVLQTYHEEMGKLIAAHGAGVDHRSGDGIMAIFNDPLPCDDPASQAVAMGIAMRARMVELCADWREVGHRLGFGVGISLGYATVGMVGSEGRYEYTASGTAVNLAARLCDHANDGEILLSPRAFRAVKERVHAEPAGEISLKGIQVPVDVFRVIKCEDPTVTNSRLMTANVRSQQWRT